MCTEHREHSKTLGRMGVMAMLGTGDPPRAVQAAGRTEARQQQAALSQGGLHLRHNPMSWNIQALRQRD